MNTREILLALVMKNKGDWMMTFQDLKNKNILTDEEIQHYCSLNKEKYITIIDEEYPQVLKGAFREPPFVLFYRGNLNLLKANNTNPDAPKTLLLAEDKPIKHINILKATAAMLDTLSADNVTLIMDVTPPTWHYLVPLGEQKYKYISVLPSAFDYDGTAISDRSAYHGEYLLLSEYPNIPTEQNKTNDKIHKYRARHIATGISTSVLYLAYTDMMDFDSSPSDIGAIPFSIGSEENRVFKNNLLIASGATPIFDTASLMNFVGVGHELHKTPEDVPSEPDSSTL